ncbi:alpha/beta hydrolase-fold protein [Rheinheimera baltica]|uniref:alpha/beta hydrolase-fold protein n=1 Tax=Rheinheimera baltica TaxID=67576 RepID=UPI00273D2B4F|nr:alpha/beta hydrolase-fold protein [Rheinheimera baltica]MDP5148959.1 alpha/beta hydrolase-fold protein [Rheinheimera baltica]
MRPFISLLMVLLFNKLAFATDVVSKEDYSLASKVVIDSNQLKEKRNILIYTPPNFDKNQTYQVIYLFDAEHLFTSTIGIVESLITTRKIPPSIVVGIETTIRVRDYLPPINGEPKSKSQTWISQKFPQFGGTEAFTTFLESELFPYIENNYPVLPNRTMIGYSNAGVYGLHTLVNSPETFTNYLLISPAAWWGNDEIDQNLSKFSTQKKDFGGNLFLSVAGEGSGMYSNALRIASKLEEVAPESLNWNFNQFENETHQSTIYPSVYQGLQYLFEDINFNVSDELAAYGSISDIQKYYSTLSNRYKYPVLIPEIVFSDLADAQFSNQRDSQAIDTLKLFADTYPNSSFAFSSLGSGYLRTKQFALAKANFEAAIKIVKKKGVSDPSVIDYLQDMVAVAQGNI